MHVRVSRYSATNKIDGANGTDRTDRTNRKMLSAWVRSGRK